MQFDLAFIGAGNMAEAIAAAVLSKRLFPAERLIAADPSDARLALFSKLGIATTTSNAEAAKSAAIVMLCVKPQMMPAALADLRSVLSPTQLIVTIAAGIGTQLIESQLHPGARIVRVMPNTPMLVGLGAAAVCAGRHAGANDMAKVRSIFEAAATVVDVDERQMDTVTAVSGSGPAYFFYVVEHLIESARALGLTPEQAQKLVYQTAAGAAKMLIESTESPRELRRKVTSPGGTTQAAIETLEAAGVGQSIQEAVAAAERRGRELGGSSGAKRG